MTLIELSDNEMPENRGPWSTVVERPFQAAVAMFAIYSGVSGLLHFGTSNEIFIAAVKYSSIFNVMFILAGLGQLVGTLTRKINIEAAALVLVSCSMLMRILATLAISGWDPSAHNMLAIGILFISASIIRIYAIIKTDQHLKMSGLIQGRHSL